MKTFKNFITEQGLDLRTSGSVPHDLEDADKFCDVVSKLEERQIKYL